MSYFLVTVATVAGVAASSRRRATMDEALRGADFMLGNGAASVWIIDGEGNIVLPADQIAARLTARNIETMRSMV